MRTIVNKTHRPLRVHLPQGKVLHLGPRNEGQIAPHAVDSPGIRKLVEAGELEVLDDNAHVGSGSRGGGHVAPDTHGHHPDTSIRSRGDR